MSSKPLRTLALAALLGVSAAPLTAAVIAPSEARASHYRLPVENFISEEETAALAKAGVATTLALLDAVGTAQKRAELAKKSGLPLERVEVLAHQVDLLRIEGLGPSVARLLTVTGVKHTRALGSESPAALLERMKAANASARILGVLPQVPLVEFWVGAAKRLPQVVTGLP